MKRALKTVLVMAFTLVFGAMGTIAVSAQELNVYNADVDAVYVDADYLPNETDGYVSINAFSHDNRCSMGGGVAPSPPPTPGWGGTTSGPGSCSSMWCCFSCFWGTPRGCC